MDDNERLIRRLGAVLRELRTERRQTMAAMAAEVGVTEATVSRWETGKTTTGIPLMQLAAYARLLGAQVEVTVWADTEAAHVTTLVRGLSAEREELVRHVAATVAGLDDQALTHLSTFLGYLRMESSKRGVAARAPQDVESGVMRKTRKDREKLED